MQSHTSEGWIARGNVRSLNVFGERGYVFVEDGSWRWRDAQQEILWEIAREGIIVGTSLRDGSVRELVVGRGEETVSGALFLNGAVVMSLVRESAGLSRVVLVTLDQRAPTELLSAAMGESHFAISVDEQLVFAWNRSVQQGRVAIYTARGALIDRVEAPWVHDENGEAWAPIDRDTVWRVTERGVESHAFRDARAPVVVCALPMGETRWLRSPIGQPLLVVHTVDADALRQYAIEPSGAARALAEHEARALASTADDHIDPSKMPGSLSARRITTMALAPDGSTLVSIDASRRLMVHRTRDGSAQLEIALDASRPGGEWIARLCEGATRAAVVSRDEWDREIALVRLDAQPAARDVRFVLPSESVVSAIAEDGSRALVEQGGPRLTIGRWTLLSALADEAPARELRCETPSMTLTRLHDERAEFEACGERAHLRVRYASEPPAVDSLRSTADHGLAVGATSSLWSDAARTSVALVSDGRRVEARDGSLFRRRIRDGVVADRAPRAAVVLDGSPCVIVYAAASASLDEFAVLTSERPTTDRVRVIALSDDGRVLAVALESGRVAIVELGAQ